MPVGVFLLSGLVLDENFRLHDAFSKRLGWGREFGALVLHFGMVRGVLYNRCLFGKISGYRI